MEGECQMERKRCFGLIVVAMVWMSACAEGDGEKLSPTTTQKQALAMGTEGESTSDPTEPAPEDAPVEGANFCNACSAGEALLDDLLMVHTQLSGAEKWDQDAALCDQVGTIPWEHGGDPAFNCRDFTYWWLTCMERLGWSDLYSLSLFCKNCEDLDARGHAQTLFRKPGENGQPGKWCPGEPQWEQGSELTACCRDTKEEAARCANQRHCERYAERVPCCVADESKRKITAYQQCEPERCRYITTVDGKTVLECLEHPVIGVDGPDVTSTDPQGGSTTSEPLTACEEAQRECLKELEDKKLCKDCKKVNFPDVCVSEAHGCEMKYVCEAGNRRYDNHTWEQAWG